MIDNQFTTSIWGDEAFSAVLSMKQPTEIISIIAQDTSPPLWNLSLWLIFQTFGVSEASIRGLALFYYCLRVFFVFLIGKTLWGKKTGFLAGLLTFFNPFFFIYAFEGRMYSILALGVTASMYFFAQIILERKRTMFNIAGYVFFSLWALYSHHFAIFVLLLQLLWFMYALITKKTETAKVLFQCFLAIGIGYAPWVIPLYNQTRMIGSGFWLGKPDQEDLKVLIYDYVAEGIKWTPFSIPFVNQPIEVVARYGIFAILALRNWFKGLKKSIFLLLWFLGPIIGTWIVSQFFTSIFYNRYLLYTIPGAMLLVASQRRKLSIIPISIVLLLFLVIDFHHFTHPTKLPFRELAMHVKEVREENDLLINWNSNAHHLWESKFYQIDAPLYNPNNNPLPFFIGTALMDADDIISEIPSDAERIGVITSGPIEDVYIRDYATRGIHEFRELKFVWLERI